MILLLSVLVRSVVFRRLGTFLGPLMRELQVFAIDGVEEENEPPAVVADYAEVFAISTNRLIEERQFLTRRRDVAIELEEVEGLEIEIMPFLRFEPLILFRSKPSLFRVFRRESGQPVMNIGCLRALQPCAVGFPEFFASSSVKATSILPISVAHHCTAAITSR